MTNEEINKECCEILGVYWHDVSDKYCCSCVRDKVPMSLKALDAHNILNPDFTTDAGAVQLLMELEKQEWYEDVALDCFHEVHPSLRSFLLVASKQRMLEEIPIKLFTTPGLLATKLGEWKEGKG
jgi:hypothetical protein